MYDNILIPIVFDQEHDHARSLQCAKSLANPDAKITLLNVVEMLPSYVMSYVPEQATDQRRAELQQSMNRLLDKVPGAKGEVITGNPGRAIVDYAASNKADLIIIESHRPGFQDYFLGSTAAYVVRRASCAVHVIR